MVKWKIGVALVLLILFLPMIANAEETIRVYSSEEVRALEKEDWYMSIYNSGSPYPWWTSERYGGMPAVNEPAEIRFDIVYHLYKEGINMEGPCEGEPVFLEISKGGVLVDDYIVESDSNGIAEFTVTFKEPGYYRYESYTGWQREHGENGTSNEFYVQSPALIDSDGDGVPDKYDYAPYDPNIQTKSDIKPEATPTPPTLIDSDGDGVPDKYDYAPYDPNVQGKSDIKTPGFEAIFAIVGLLLGTYFLRRRR